jgi:ribose transport system ATP-binding protein
MDQYRVKGVVENNGLYADMSHDIMALIHHSEESEARLHRA